MNKFVMLTSSCVLSIVLFVTSFPATADGAKILIYPYGHCLNSHLLNAERLGDILSLDGHQVDMLVSSAYFNFDHRRNLNVTDTMTMVTFPAPENFIPICDYDSLDFMLYAPLKDRFATFYETAIRNCDHLLTHKMKSLKQAAYDLVIVEALDPCSRILVDYLDRPYVILVSLGLGHFDSNPRPPSYLPAAIAPFTSNMNFGQRLMNTMIKLMYDRIIPALLGTLAPFEELKRKHAINESLSLADSFDRAAIRLVNSDFSIEYPAPVEPDNILVGGYSVEAPSALPADLQQFIDGSGKDGVILMSFGTLVKRFDGAWTKMFADVFARLPQRVIWRYSGPLPDNYTMSPNVKLMRWVPQVSVLNHPKTKLFISHCGINSLFEAVHFGMPVLAIPLSGDQMNNAAKISGHLRMGLGVNIHTMTSDTLYDDIQTILRNKEFAVNAKEVSQRLTDQPMSPAEKIKFWIDYVIRHNGNIHLRSDASRLAWYQYLCLDVITCILAMAVVALAFLLFSLYRVFGFTMKLVAFVRNRLNPKVKVN